jgi:hypothetical protein
MTQRLYVVLMEDPIIHTVDQPVCDDPGCICAQCEYDLLRSEAEAASRRRRRTSRRPLIESKPVPGSLDGNRPFSLLRE